MAQKVINTPWTPAFTLDLSIASRKAFEEVLKEFRAWASQQTKKPLQLSMGRHIYTPEMAEHQLIHNAANREPVFPHIKRIANVMLEGQWKVNGQCIIVNADGKLEDGQHRLFGCYFSGASFETYGIYDVPVDPLLFLSLDDNRSRSHVDSLITAGVSRGAAYVLRHAAPLAIKYENDRLDVFKNLPVPRLTNNQFARYISSHPHLEETTHILLGTYSVALDIINDTAAAVVFADKMRELYGEDELDDFFAELTSDEKREDTDPIKGLLRRLNENNAPDARKGERKNRIHVLAWLIKGFNMHKAGARIPRKGGLQLGDNEPYPRFPESDC